MLAYGSAEEVLIIRSIESAWYGYAAGALIGIPLLFIVRARWDKKVARRRALLKWEREAELELGIGDEALVRRVYGEKP